MNLKQLSLLFPISVCLFSPPVSGYRSRMKVQCGSGSSTLLPKRGTWVPDIHKKNRLEPCIDSIQPTGWPRQLSCLLTFSLLLRTSLHFYLSVLWMDADPDPALGFWWQKILKVLQLKKNPISNKKLHFSNSRPPWRLFKLQEKLSVLKENIQQVKQISSLFAIFMGLFRPPVSVYGSSRPHCKRSADPDPQHCYQSLCIKRGTRVPSTIHEKNRIEKLSFRRNSVVMTI